MKVPSALAALGTVVVMAAGCSHHRAPSSAVRLPSTSTSLPNTAFPVTGASATTAPGAPTSTSPLPTTVADSRCATSSLTVTLTGRGAAAGTEFLELDFKNTTARSCTLQGYPGVSFVDARGGQIGAPVPRTNGTAGEVTVTPGAIVGALISYHDVVVGSDNCQPATTAGIRVYPPNQTASVVVRTNIAVCANPAFAGTAGVSPVAAPANLHP